MSIGTIEKTTRRYGESRDTSIGILMKVEMENWKSR